MAGPPLDLEENVTLTLTRYEWAALVCGLSWSEGNVPPGMDSAGANLVQLLQRDAAPIGVIARALQRG